MDARPAEGPALAAARRADACALVIFGAGGDLTQRLLMPALYNLAVAGLLAEGFAIIGVARAALSDEAFRDGLAERLRRFATAPVAEAAVAALLRHVAYVRGDFGDPATFLALKDRLAEIGRSAGTGGNCLFYLATPPAAFATVVEGLASQGLTREEKGTWRRVVVEKPFGSDLASAQKLNRLLLRNLKERQIFRIDHYLGKETVQNILILRFANGLFEPIWNRHHIDHVQITVAETVSVESRGNFYDATGALRDMVPNHLFQLLALIGMEPPSRFDADAVRSEKTKVLDAVHLMTQDEAAADTVRAQYAAGGVGGRPIAAYREAKDVAADSTTETYVALRLVVDNWRWAGVPFYLRTGKALAARRTEIAIKFRRPPLALFRDTPVDRLDDNVLVLRIQPDEGAWLQFNAKVPGQEMRIGTVRMDFRYKDYFAAAQSTGYETLLFDCMLGDATLFQRADNVEAGWRVVQPILESWRQARQPVLAFYAAGGEGPEEAAALLARDGRVWRPIG